MSYKWIPRAGMSLLFSIMGTLVAPAQGVPPSNRQGPQTDVRVFPLQHVPAQEAAMQVQQIMGHPDTKVAVDSHTNALIVATTAEKLAQIEALLPQLDRPSQAVQERRTYYVELPAPPSPQLISAAQMALQGERSVLSAVDRTLVVLGEERDYLRVQELVERTARNRLPGQQPLQVTFYLLGASLDPKGTSKGSDLPLGLKEVAQALTESGFFNARLRAPLVVYTNTGGERFHLNGGAGADEISVRGEVASLDGETVQLSVDLAINSMIRTPSAPSAEPGAGLQLRTAVKAKMGEYVALVASPTRAVDMEAVIIVLRVSGATAKE